MAFEIPDVAIPSCKYCGEQFYGEDWWICKKCGAYVCPECADIVVNEETGQKNMYFEESDQEGAEDIGPFCASCFSLEEKTRKNAIISSIVCAFGVLLTSRRVPGLKELIPDDVLYTTYITGAFLIALIASLYNIVRSKA